MEPWVLKVLACPLCQSGLVQRGVGGVVETLQCVSRSCGAIFRVDDGIAVLLADEATFEQEQS